MVFVGGTGRSGTHVLAQAALPQHDRWRSCPVEVRFHVDARAFPGLLVGQVSKAQFLRRLRGFWWKGFQTSRMRGMYRFVTASGSKRAVADVRGRLDEDPEAACRQPVLRPALAVRSGAGRRRRR